MQPSFHNDTLKQVKQWQRSALRITKQVAWVLFPWRTNGALFLRLLGSGTAKSPAQDPKHNHEVSNTIVR